jgi:hypothetical protein
MIYVEGRLKDFQRLREGGRGVEGKKGEAGKYCLEAGGVMYILPRSTHP